MVQFNQTQEDLENLFYCSLEQDPSGEMCEELVAELLEDGFSKEQLLKAQQKASLLFSKNSY